MFNKLFAVTVLSGALFFSSSADARPGHNGRKGHVMKMLNKDVELSDSQKVLLYDLGDIKGERVWKKEGKRKNWHNWMVEYVSGDIDREQVLDQIDEKFEVKKSLKKEKTKLFLSLLDSYSADQRSQVLENLEELKERRTKKMEKRAGNSKWHSKKRGKFKALFRDLDLTEQQKEIIQETMEVKKKSAEKVSKGSKLDFIEAYLTGKKRRKAIFSDTNSQLKEFHDNAHERTELLLELFDSFDDAQKEQFLINVENKKSNRRNNRRR